MRPSIQRREPLAAKPWATLAIAGISIALAVPAAQARLPVASDTPDAAASELLPEGSTLAGQDGTTRPQRTYQVLPRYPARALREEIAGNVELLIQVRADGSVGDVQVVSSSPTGYSFSDAASHAVQKWVFGPALKKGRPVEVYLPLSILFAPEDYLRDRRWEEHKEGLRVYAAAEVFRQEDHVAGEDGVTWPVLRRRSALGHPAGARVRNVESRVLMLIVVSENGKVTDIPLAHAERSDFQFKEVAEKAVRRWRFDPATLENAPVPAYHWVEVSFTNPR